MMKTSSDTSAEEILDQPADTRALTPAFCMAPSIVLVRASTSSTTIEPNLIVVSGYVDMKKHEPNVDWRWASVQEGVQFERRLVVLIF